jgi:hypothetical protein
MSQRGEPQEPSSSSMEEVVPESTMTQYSLRELAEPPRSKKCAVACAHACEGIMTPGLTCSGAALEAWLHFIFGIGQEHIPSGTPGSK